MDFRGLKGSTVWKVGLFGVGFQVGDRLAHGLNVFRLIVRNGKVEFFLEFHDQFNGIEESAPKSLVKLASGVTSFSSTPNLSTMMERTLLAISDMWFWVNLDCNITRNSVNFIIHPNQEDLVPLRNGSQGPQIEFRG